MLTVATAAARAGEAAGEAAGSAAEVARAAYDGARAALAETPGQLAVLGRAGVVDAGGCGLVAVLGALWQALSGEVPAAEPVRGRAVPVPQTPEPCAQEQDGPAVRGDLPAGGLRRGRRGTARTARRARRLARRRRR